jgi:nucleotide-binding universal stress UspA family protein
MVVLIARPRSLLCDLFHGSVTAHVLLHSPVPVLVLPAE